jgi:hypothetical protein
MMQAKWKALRDDAFWSVTALVGPERIRPYPKSNSGDLRVRTWRCEHGVASVEVCDTLLHARLSAWMERVRKDWG